MERQFGAKAMCYDYGPHSEATHPLIRDDPDADLWSFRERLKTRGLMCLAGHSRVSRYINLFGAERTLTFVRDPIQRVVSEYHHFVRNYNYALPLSDFAAERRFQNKQTRTLSDIPLGILGFVGVMERYEDSLRLLNSEWGLDLVPLELNMGRADLQTVHAIDGPTRKRLAELNREDQLTYEHAVWLFDQRLAMECAGLPFVRGRVLGIQRKIVRGWAVRATGSAVTIEVLVNGQAAAECTASLFDSAALAYGVGRGGFVRFRARLPKLKLGDQVVVRTQDTSQALRKKPIIVGAQHL